MVRRPNSTLPAFLITLLITSLLPISARSQSGRGRPKVPNRAPTTEAPPPKVPEATAVVKQEQAGSISRFVLRNGMTVIISEQHAAPLTAAVACFKVGQRDELLETPGISRLLERVVFRSAVERIAAPSALDPRSLGDMIGANTGYDTTCYYSVAPPSKVQSLLAFQAEMIQEPAIPADQLRREIADLIEEDKWNGGIPPAYDQDDRPTRYSEPADYAMGRLLEMSPGRLSKGFKRIQADVLRSITREQIADFHRAHYRPSNLILTIVGDVSTFGTLVEIQQRYGEFGVTRRPAQPTAEAPKPEARSRPVEPKASPRTPVATNEPAPKPAVTAPPVSAPEERKLRYSASRGDLTQSIVTVGFEVPGTDSADWPAIEVLSALIGLGRGSRLAHSLLVGPPVLSGAESGYLKFKDGGLLTAQIWVDPGGIDKAESMMFKELDRLRREQPGVPELSRVQTLLEKQFLDRTATYLGRARALAQAEAVGAGYRTAVEYRNRIRAVRAEDVQRAAAKYLSTATASVYEYEPQMAPARSFDPERFAATIAAWAPAFSQPVSSSDVRQADAPTSASTPPAQGAERTAIDQATFESVEPLPVKDFSTLNGPRAFVREDHSLPLVTIALLFQGGRIVEDEKTSGITELMLRSMLHGTERQTAVRVADQLEQLGAEIEVVNEPDFFGVLVSSLSRNADRTLLILRDIIEDPAFREEDVSRARLVQMGMIRGARDSGTERSRELFLQALYPGHPYALPAHGREDVVGKTNGDQLRDWHERTVKRQVPLAIIVGDTDGSALISGQIAEGFRRRELDRTLQLRVPGVAKPTERVEQRPGQPSTVVVGFNGPKGDSPDLAILEVIESVLNRPGGKVLAQSKEKPDFAYSARIDHQALLTTGSIFVELTTSPEGEARARSLMAGEIERIARSGFTAEQLAAGVAASSASRLAQLQSPSIRILNYADALFHQRQPSDVDALADRLSKVTMEDVKRVLALYFKAASLSSGVVRGSSAAPAK
jgi:zinc protease